MSICRERLATAAENLPGVIVVPIVKYSRENIGIAARRYFYKGVTCACDASAGKVPLIDPPFGQGRRTRLLGSFAPLPRASAQSSLGGGGSVQAGAAAMLS